LAPLGDFQGFVTEMVAEFDKRPHLVHERPNSIEGFRYTLLQGAVYAFANVEAFGMCSEEFSEFLRENAHVITVPGSAFDSRDEGYIRISYAAAYVHLEKA
jgi:aspartate/methionine/tyrosine aminotransferase